MASVSHDQIAALFANAGVRVVASTYARLPQIYPLFCEVVDPAAQVVERFAALSKTGKFIAYPLRPGSSISTRDARHRGSRAAVPATAREGFGRVSRYRFRRGRDPSLR